MTTPDDAPPTVADPGRSRGGAGDSRGGSGPAAWDGRPTALDPGRRPRDRARQTEIDPGRSQPAGAPSGLPPRLAERFRVEDDLTESGAQGDVYQVVGRSDGVRRVVKVYRPGWRPDPRVTEFLGGGPSEHVVGHEEAGVDDDRFYEVMPYLSGGNLLKVRKRHPTGVAPDVLEEVVRRLTAGLTAIHAAGIVHRDIKPANLVVGNWESRSVAIADFGIALHLPAGEAYTDDHAVGTVPYTPPEFVAGRILPAFDWWSLGICVLELATGEQLYAGISKTGIVRSRIIERPIDTDAIGDDHIRLLCDGLLTIDPHDRWGAEQVTAWLRGERPAVSTAARPDSGARQAAEPYSFAGNDYWNRTDLAADLIKNWGTALAVLCGDDSGPRERLLAWLATLPDTGIRIPPAPRRAPADVRLLHLIRAVDPTFPPWYRRCNIAVGPLTRLAQDGHAGNVPSPDIVTELWDYDLFRLLATGETAGDAVGGQGLAEVHAKWRQAQEMLAAQARGVENTDARRAAERFLREERGRALSLALLAATVNAETERQLQAELDRQARAFRLDWFSFLVAGEDSRWIAVALAAHAEAESARLAQEEAARRAHEDWLRRTEGLRDWSRRQNRPQALSYAAAGVATIAAVLFALVGLGDVAGVASDAQIIDSWVGVVAALLLGLVAEGVLAWDIGGRFHPAYSLLGAGRVAVGRLARSLVARRIAGPVALAAVAVMVVVAIWVPVGTPFLVAFLLLPWTVRRYEAWREQDRREREILAQPSEDRPSPTR